MSTSPGILDTVARCRKAGLPAPGFRQSGGQFIQTLRRPRVAALPRGTTDVTTDVTRDLEPEVRLVRVLDGEMSRRQIQRLLGLKNDEHFRKAYLQPALERGLIEMMIPDKPRSTRQRYRLTPKGVATAARDSHEARKGSETARRTQSRPKRATRKMAKKRTKVR